MTSTPMPSVRRRLAAMLGALALLQVAGPAQADDERVARVPLLPKYQQECAACHLADGKGAMP